ncbi:MAG TPA: PspC domain-containing protein [Candidatus Paceibacterota bacterium]|nr:PspC domain-containing protein [Candidatus Paceibacterota bacterium]
MEKTTHITIASTEFRLTESAYDKLEKYLSALSEHFKGEEGGAEIIRDIESRIAEKLLETKHGLITLANVEAVIAEIGNPAELDVPIEEALQEGVRKYRKLYRNMDYAVLAGVASGIAAYFGIDPLVIRLIFVISIFFGGIGIVIYVLLAIFVPAAHNASQKLEMRGDAVTLDGISRVVKDRSSEEKRESGFRRVIYFPFEVIAAIGRFIANRLSPVALRIAGLLLALVTFLAALALTVAVGVAWANWNAPWNDFPLKPVMSGGLMIFTSLMSYLAVIIPLFLIFALGFRLFRRRNFLPSAVGIGLVGIWSLALIAAGITWTKVGSDYHEYEQTSPEYQIVERTLDVTGFTKIEAHDVRVAFSSEGTSTVSIEGREADLGSVTATTTPDGTLVLTGNDQLEASCFFMCFHSRPTVIISTSSVSAIDIDDSSLTFDDFEGGAISLKAKDSNVRGTLHANSLSLELEDSGAYATVDLASLQADLRDSHLEFDGTANTATINAVSSSVDSSSLFTNAMTLSTQGSSANVSAENFTLVKSTQSTVYNNDKLVGGDDDEKSAGGRGEESSRAPTAPLAPEVQE